MLIIYDYITNYVSGGAHCTAVGLACLWVMLCRYLSVVMLLCRSCSLLTPYSLLSTAHYSFVHCFTARSIPLTYITAHSSLFNWNDISTETRHRIPSPVRLAVPVAKLWQRRSYSISILMSIGRKLWIYMCMCQHNYRCPCSPGTHCRAGDRQSSGYELLSLDMWL